MNSDQFIYDMIYRDIYRQQYNQYLTVLFVFLVIFAVIGGIVAYKKNRSVIGWALLCLFFGFIPLVIICALPSLSGNSTGIYNAGSSPSKRKLEISELRCKSCGSIVEDGFRRCPHCGGELTSEANPSINLTNISSLISKDVIIICPFCNNKIKVDIPIKELKYVLCTKCNRKINKNKMLFDDT